MNLSKRGWIVSLGALVAMPGAAWAADDTSMDNLLNRLEQLESERTESDAKIATLESELAEVRAANGDDQWLTEARSEEIRGIVQDVLADADTRASLLSNNLQAGWDKNFYLGDTAGNFLLKIRGQIQVRFEFNYRDDSGNDDVRSGFEVRRAKIQFGGHVVDPSWTYALNLAMDRRGLTTNGDIEVEDAIVTKEFADGYFLTVGQLKMPFNFEEQTSSTRLQAVDRSMINEEFNLDRSVGIQFMTLADEYSLRAMVSNGSGNRIGPALEYDVEFAGSIRGEYFFGDRGDFKDYQGWQGQELAGMIGTGFYYEKQEFGTPLPDPKEQTISVTVDGLVKGDGWNVAAAFYYRNLDEADQNQFGVTVQGGFFIVPNEWELYGRFQWGDEDASDVDDLLALTIGANYFFNKHGLKWTNDFTYNFNEVSSTWATTGVGSLPDAPGQNGQIMFRSQFQLLF